MIATVWRHLRLWRRFVLLSLAQEAEYRTNLLVGVGAGLGQMALAVLTFALIYRFTDRVGGWSLPQALLLAGIYRIVDGVIAVQLTPNLWAMADYIRSGEMDLFLVRPVSSQFLVSLRLLRPAEAANIFIGLALVLYAAPAAGVHWTALAVAEAVAFGLCGLAALYSLWFATVTLAFWLVQVDTLATLFYAVFEAARYPVSFFRGGVRTLLTVVIPVAFATTFPTQALLGTADHRLLLVGAALAAAALGAAHLFWNYAVGHYASASS